jgi:hypothetical protein
MPDIYSLLNSKDYMHTNLYLAHALGVDAAFSYTALLERRDECEKKDLLDDNGFFFCPVERLFLTTTIQGAAQTKALKMLEKSGLVVIKTNGDPAKRYIKITYDDNALITVLEKGAKICNKI